MVRFMRRRYIAFKLDSDSFPSKQELVTVLRYTVAINQRQVARKQNNIRIIEYDAKTGFGILRCDQKTVSMLRNLTKLFGVYNIETIKTSGTIKALKRKLASKIN